MTRTQITTIRNTVVAATILGAALIAPMHGFAASGNNKPPSSMFRPTLQPSDLTPTQQLPDPKVITVSATCKPGQRIEATVTIENATGVPTGKQIATKVMARAVKPKKSPSGGEPPVILGDHITPAGFTGVETFTRENGVPYSGYPQDYRVLAKLSVGEKEVTSVNNRKGTSVTCSW